MRQKAWVFSILALATLAAVPAEAGQLPALPRGGCPEGCYTWTVSFSPTDPYLHESAPATLDSAYVWFACTEHSPGGMAAMECAVVATGGIGVAGFQAMNGFLDAGSGTHLLLAVGGCPSGPLCAGRLTLVDPLREGGRLCLGPWTNGNNVTVDCEAVPRSYDNGCRGATTDGSVPCEYRGGSGPGCYGGGVAVEASRWGSIKATYR